MSELLPRQAFSPSCPSGGTWYACTTDSLFVGCCDGSASPCALGCPDGLLQPASFDPAYWGKFPDQDCSIGSSWYTCADTTPPFMGCCETNPCQAGHCPTGNLTPGYLSSDQALAAPFESNDSAPSDSAPSDSAPSNSAQLSNAPSSIAPSSNALSSSALSSSAPSSTVADPIISVTGGAPTSLPLSSTINTASTASIFPSFSQSTTASSTTVIPSAISTESAIAIQSGSASKPTSGPVLVSAVMGGIAGGTAIIALLLGLSLYLWRRHASRRGKEHLGPVPLDPQENAYTDSSPITPIQPHRVFNFSPTDKEYGPSPLSSMATIKMSPSLPSRPAYNAFVRSPSPPAGPLSRSLSELESGRDGIKIAAELEGNGLPRLNTSDLSREGRDAEIESPIDPGYRVSSARRTKHQTERRIDRETRGADNFI